MMTSNCKKTDQAVKKARDAMTERLVAEEFQRSGIDPSSGEFHQMQAEKLEKEANDLLVLTGLCQHGAGGEVIPTDESSNELARNTLEAPNVINVAGSASRVDQLTEAGVLAAGLDAAQSVGADNSLEMMLVHQMALCHDRSFKVITEAEGQKDPVEKARLLNAGARLMKVFQDGLLALNKIRTGGRQTVLVQHVQVSDGGQAVVSGMVKGGKDGG